MLLMVLSSLIFSLWSSNQKIRKIQNYSLERKNKQTEKKHRQKTIKNKYNSRRPLAFQIQRDRVGNQSNQTILYNCHHAKSQGLMELNDHTIFFSEFQRVCKKSVYSICSFLKYSKFQSPITRLDTLIFLPYPPKNLLINFYLMRICINIQM